MSIKLNSLNLNGIKMSIAGTGPTGPNATEITWPSSINSTTMSTITDNVLWVKTTVSSRFVVLIDNSTMTEDIDFGVYGTNGSLINDDTILAGQTNPYPLILDPGTYYIAYSMTGATFDSNFGASSPTSLAGNPIVLNISTPNLPDAFTISTSSSTNSYSTYSTFPDAFSDGVVWYKFNVAAPGAYTIDTIASGITQLHTSLKIYGANGELLDSPSNYYVGGLYNMSFITAAPGTYYIAAGLFNVQATHGFIITGVSTPLDGTSGEITVNVSETVAPVAPTSTSTSLPLVNLSVTESSANILHNVAWYSFNVSTTGVYDTTFTSAPSGGRFMIYSADGNTYASSYTPSATLTAGTYYLAVGVNPIFGYRFNASSGTPLNGYEVTINISQQ